MADIDGFIARWTANEGGQERANYALFLSELADVIGVPRPDPANASTENNDYVLERAVKEPNGDGTFNHRRIDLYKRGCFVLEAKQSRLRPGSPKALEPAPAAGHGSAGPRGRRGADRSWDALMFDAKAQAVNYARCLPPDHGWPTEEVAMFLMRCLFTMFAEDVDLLPKYAFRDVLKRCEADPAKFPHLVGQMWEAMDTGGFALAIEAKVRQFNGAFFKNRAVLPLGREAIADLRAAAEADWREVEPAIFGTLLEQALDPDERRRLGAHYTPRAYVERLVVATVIEPLRDDWTRTLATTERQRAEGRRDEAIASLRAFHDGLCRLRVLDPACGTGNFLYVALELIKRLEGEVLEALAALGGQESFSALEGHTVDPHQFLGLELNPRAAAIAELVLWIGYLQWHHRTRGAAPAEPILRAFRNIRQMDAVLTFDGYPLPTVVDGRETFPNPRRPEWPEAEYIVGNPPFIGSKFMRERLGSAYAEALWAAHTPMNESADFVMHWWDRAADLLTRRGTALRRFGLVTTNSISQVFQRRVMERHLNAKAPVSIVMAIPDHPWTKASRDAAAVRIAMTVVEAGKREGVLREVVREAGLETDAPEVELAERRGAINPNLTMGVDVTQSLHLESNVGICSPGVKLHGSGFIISSSQAEYLGLGQRSGIERHLRRYMNGRDLTDRPRDVLIVDLFGLTADQVRQRFPEIYQHIKLEVKEKIELKDGIEIKTGRDWNNRNSYRENWWIFGEPRSEFRPALEIQRYIATPVTQKHRFFSFIDGNIVPDDALMVVASDDAFHLGVLSSGPFAVWFSANASTLEDRPRFIKSRCFDPFPFPATDDLRKQRIRAIAEDLDAHRKRVLADHPHLTLTGLYNVLERLKAGVTAAALEPAERRIFDDGLVLILKELHDRLDTAVADAYGWPADLADENILARLVALNKERAAEEARGEVRWLRPDYQIPRFGSARDKAEQIEAALVVPEAATSRPAYPKADGDQTAVVMAALMDTPAGLDVADLAARFRKGRGVEARIGAVLAALQRMGIAWSDDGRRWRLRRAA